MIFFRLPNFGRKVQKFDVLGHKIVTTKRREGHFLKSEHVGDSGNFAGTCHSDIHDYGIRQNLYNVNSYRNVALQLSHGIYCATCRGCRRWKWGARPGRWMVTVARRLSTTLWEIFVIEFNVGPSQFLEIEPTFGYIEMCVTVRKQQYHLFEQESKLLRLYMAV